MGQRLTFCQETDSCLQNFIQKEQKLYRWRAQNNAQGYLPKVYFVNESLRQQQQEFAALIQQSSSSHMLDLDKVKTAMKMNQGQLQPEHIITFQKYQYTLADIRESLQIAEVIYVLSTMFGAYTLLRQVYSQVMVSVRCCFVTARGQVRMWINKNPKCNNVDRSLNKTVYQISQETSIAQEIVEEVSLIAVKNQQNLQFLDYVKRTIYKEKNVLNRMGKILFDYCCVHRITVCNFITKPQSNLKISKNVSNSDYSSNSSPLELKNQRHRQEHINISSQFSYRANRVNPSIKKATIVHTRQASTYTIQSNQATYTANSKQHYKRHNQTINLSIPASVSSQQMHIIVNNQLIPLAISNPHFHVGFNQSPHNIKFHNKNLSEPLYKVVNHQPQQITRQTVRLNQPATTFVNKRPQIITRNNDHVNIRYCSEGNKRTAASQSLSHTDKPNISYIEKPAINQIGTPRQQSSVIRAYDLQSKKIFQPKPRSRVSILQQQQLSGYYLPQKNQSKGIKLHFNSKVDSNRSMKVESFNTPQNIVSITDLASQRQTSKKSQVINNLSCHQIKQQSNMMQVTTGARKAWMASKTIKKLIGNESDEESSLAQSWGSTQQQVLGQYSGMLAKMGKHTHEYETNFVHK